MFDIINEIKRFNYDENVVKLKNHFSSYSFMEILGLDRDESAHSSFLKWMFDANYNFNLGEKPLILLIDLLLSKENCNNTFSNEERELILFRKFNIDFREIKREYYLDKESRIDLFIHFIIEFDKGKKTDCYIFLENKFDSDERIENGISQTTKYANIINKEYNKPNQKCLKVFLSLDKEADNKEFINIYYKDILKRIIIPLLYDEDLSQKARFFLNDYLNVLSKPNTLTNSPRIIDLDEDTEDNKLLKIIKDDFESLINWLEKNSKNEITKNFLDNTLNKLIIGSIKPNILKSRIDNIYLTDLDINDGEILYLADKANSNVKADPVKKVTVIDSRKNIVENNDGYKTTLSDMAKLFNTKRGYTSTNYRGTQWFIYKKDDKEINLVKYYEEKNSL